MTSLLLAVLLIYERTDGAVVYIFLVVTSLACCPAWRHGSRNWSTLFLLSWVT
jgi:hypothetical protein